MTIVEFPPRPESPTALSLSFLLADLECYAVRMKYYDEVDNLSPRGGMIWPEVLICKTKEEAEKVCDYLNEESYQEAKEDWLEGEPFLSENELRQRWYADKIAIYIVEHVPNIKNYPLINKIELSEVTAKKLQLGISYI